MNKFALILASATALSCVGVYANDSAPDVVISVQKLLDKNHRGIKALTRAANRAGASLEWDLYKTDDHTFCEATSEDYCFTVIPSRTVVNRNRPSAKADFEILEVTSKVTKKEWKEYKTYKYVLVDAYTNETLASSPVVKEKYTGGCKPNGMCEMVFIDNTPMGTSKTKALTELIKYAVKLKQ